MPTNEDRAAWAAHAIEAFAQVCAMEGEDDRTKAKDLATNIVHHLRLNCGLTLEQAAVVMDTAVTMARIETQEDLDAEENSDA